MHRYDTGTVLPHSHCLPTPLRATYKYSASSCAAACHGSTEHACRQTNGGQKPGYVAGQNAFAALDTKPKKKKKAKDESKGKKDKAKAASGTSTTTGGGGGVTTTALPTITDVNFDDLNWADDDDDDGFAMAPMADWVQVPFH